MLEWLWCGFLYLVCISGAEEGIKILVKKRSSSEREKEGFRYFRLRVFCKKPLYMSVGQKVQLAVFGCFPLKYLKCVHIYKHALIKKCVQ